MTIEELLFMLVKCGTDAAVKERYRKACTIASEVIVTLLSSEQMKQTQNDYDDIAMTLCKMLPTATYRECENAAKVLIDKGYLYDGKNKKK